MCAKAPRIFRVTVEVSDLEAATTFYATLLGIEGKRHPGARHYFDCGGVILAVLDVSRGGLTPTPGPKSLYFAVNDVEAVHARARDLDALAPYEVHGEAAGEVLERPWGERSFYAVDAWGNDLAWLGKLFDAAELVPAFRLESVRSLLDDDEAAAWHAAKEAALAETCRSRHRASRDADVLRRALMRVKRLGQATAQLEAGD